jgi:hypothetical protein
MKTINITPKLNRAEKKILTFLNTFFYDEECKNDETDVTGYVKKQFIKLRKDTDELICFDEPIR